MFGLGLPEVAIISIVVAIFFFGGEKISGFAREMGRVTGEFKKGRAEVEAELKKTEKELKPDKK